MYVGLSGVANCSAGTDKCTRKVPMHVVPGMRTCGAATEGVSKHASLPSERISQRICFGVASVRSSRQCVVRISSDGILKVGHGFCHAKFCNNDVVLVRQGLGVLANQVTSRLL